MDVDSDVKSGGDGEWATPPASVARPPLVSIAAASTTHATVDARASSPQWKSHAQVPLRFRTPTSSSSYLFVRCASAAGKGGRCLPVTCKNTVICAIQGGFVSIATQHSWYIVDTSICTFKITSITSQLFNLVREHVTKYVFYVTKRYNKFR